MTSLRDTDTTAYPDALYLACSEAPMPPGAAATGASGPSGELLTVRNIGNLVPTDPAEGSVDAALDFALNALQVRTIVVCGHSGCGAMASLLSESIDTPTSSVGRWLDNARDTLGAYREFHLARVGAAARGFSQADQLAVVNVVIQVERLVHHPILVAAVVSGRLQVAGTFYSADTGSLYEVSATGIPTPGVR
ncbi:carbonic anhydrase [Mycobacteroides franklinii]|uniref:carbonic anhydrase n=1 Tax=Mycobacteroides franklinii TaxID=948102 RepID=UPI0013E8CDD4|nr:carbonic anhydrase [Mycobacteroides franklinii]